MNLSFSNVNRGFNLDSSATVVTLKPEQTNVSTLSKSIFTSVLPNHHDLQKCY